MKLKSWIEVIKETLRVVPEQSKEDHVGFRLLQESGKISIYGNLDIMKSIAEKLNKEAFYYDIGNSMWALFAKRETVKGSFGVYILSVSGGNFVASTVNSNDDKPLNEDEQIFAAQLKDILFQTFPHRLTWLLTQT
jgi:hypothetical protein